LERLEDEEERKEQGVQRFLSKPHGKFMESKVWSEKKK
jgi:hypothetical protein